ncbi:MAG: hypothetical protein WC505_01845 [Patescibacteria group bacterium]
MKLRHCSVFVTLMAVLVCCGIAGADDTKPQLQLQLNICTDSSVIRGFGTYGQLILADVNSDAFPWLFYAGLIDKVLDKKRGDWTTLGFLAGAKGSQEEQTLSGLVSLRTDGLIKVGALWLKQGSQCDYYFRDKGLLTWTLAEVRLRGMSDVADEGLFAGFETEYYTDRTGTPELFDIGPRIDLAFSKVNLWLVYFTRYEYPRLYFNVNL